MKRGNARGAKGAGHSGLDQVGQRQQEEPTDCGGEQPLSMDGTNRVSREAQARFCERLGVKVPGATRPGVGSRISEKTWASYRTIWTGEQKASVCRLIRIVR
jgi:hypothetical protein